MMRLLGVLLSGSILVACSGGSDGFAEADPLATRLATVVSVLRPAPAPEPFAPTREQLAATGLTGPLIAITVEAQDATAGMLPVASSGRTITWETADAVAISTRGGVLSATRGMGQDLLDAETAPLERALQGNGPRVYRRSLTILDGSNAPRVLTMDCRLEGGGAETVEIVGRAVPVHTWRESCRLDADAARAARAGGVEDGTVHSAFLVGRGAAGPDGMVRASRQWVGPRTGYVSLSRINP